MTQRNVLLVAAGHQAFASLIAGDVPALDYAATATAHAHVHGEQFTGTGAQTVFTLAHTPKWGVSTFLAGVKVDVTVSTNTVTFAVAPILNATIRIDYEWSA